MVKHSPKIFASKVKLTTTHAYIYIDRSFGLMSQDIIH